MIKYALGCAEGHAFDSWFPDSAAYEKQRKRGFVVCPECGSTRVDKAIMAPAVVGGERGAVEAGPEMAVDDRRRQSLSACNGTGAKRSASASRSAPARAIQRATGRASSARSEYLSRCTSVRAGPSSNRATARARANAGGSATACGEMRPCPRSCSNGVPRRSQKGRSMKRIALQQRGQSAPCLSVAARQARHVGG